MVANSICLLNSKLRIFPSKKKIEYSRVANKKYTSKNNVGDHSKFS